MTSISNSICPAFIKDKYENILICLTFVIFTIRTNITSDLSCICPELKPNMIKSIISPSVTIYSVIDSE